ADFLGTWISPVAHTADCRRGRDLETGRVSWHVQFEPRMSITGSKADLRFAIAPAEMSLLLMHLAHRLARTAGQPFVSANREPVAMDAAFLDELADRMWQARGRSLVVCGSNDQRQQVLVNFVNHLLGNYGATLDLDRPSLQAEGDDRSLETLLGELRQGKVQALFAYGVNPVFNLPGSEPLSAFLRKVPLMVSFAPHLDETAALAKYVLPEPHYLESWSDVEAVSGVVALSQPTVPRFGDTRSLLETIAA